MEEVLSFDPSGQGEHLLLWVEKRESNTEWVAKQLAKHFGIGPSKVSWAGLKDRHAVTRQWFGVHLPGFSGELEYPDYDNCRVLDHRFNDRKLRIGAIKQNHFRLRIANIHADRLELEARLEAIKQRGVPNYFGEQRFGLAGNNLTLAEQWLVHGQRPRKKMDQSMALSAARSYLFNQQLSARIAESLWTQVRAGDVLMLDNTHSVFVAQADELAELQQRVDEGDCHTTALLPGSGGNIAQAEVAEWECSAYDVDQKQWCSGLIKQKVKASRRAARLIPQNLSWEFIGDDQALLLNFSLPTGAYATSVLREFLDYPHSADV